MKELITFFGSLAIVFGVYMPLVIRVVRGEKKKSEQWLMEAREEGRQVTGYIIKRHKYRDNPQDFKSGYRSRYDSSGTYRYFTFPGGKSYTRKISFSGSLPNEVVLYYPKDKPQKAQTEYEIRENSGGIWKGLTPVGGLLLFIFCIRLFAGLLGI